MMLGSTSPTIDLVTKISMELLKHCGIADGGTKTFKGSLRVGGTVAAANLRPVKR